MKEVKVIFHVDEMTKWGLVLKNVSNLLQVVDPGKSNIVVLANSEAVKLYNINSEDKEMEKLNSQGVKFLACNNALNIFEMKKENLLNFVGIVPVGVLEIINKEGEGYAYIKS